ncbi:hypothetical protein CLPU_6c00390 [Gottschalkia purinilytica]|uniref:Uncharacterized protein n=1 Tax=Gottschalkia purinilytica TaxID=1503 RepID=A0A0L0WAL6_GOTPU|nr:hypothetical protein [Gottschalkia purinilytica]KNF08553.1 hypothetical protein CLPU_6c00390 [Gottschalkia purinilytica]
MTENKILENIKEFLEKEICSKFKLELPNNNGLLDEDYKLVNPAVYIGWIPPKNYLDNYGYDVPALIVMSDGGEDLGESSNLNIRIGIVTYDPGLSSEETIPNFKGYKDLLNIISRIRIELSNLSSIEKIGAVERPIKWGMYEEQTYPYWHGWITFQVSTASLNYLDLEQKYL